MARKRNILVLSLVALSIASLSFSPAYADGMDCKENDCNLTVSKSEARQIVEKYLRKIGYTEMGLSAFSARTGRTSLAGNVWQVSVLAGDRYVVNQRFILQVDAHTGSLRLN